MKTIIRTNGLKNHRNDETELKTIKELEATYHEDNRYNSIYERGLIALGKIQALKEILGVIDEEVKKRGDVYIDAEELKARIKG